MCVCVHVCTCLCCLYPLCACTNYVRACLCACVHHMSTLALIYIPLVRVFGCFYPVCACVCVCVWFLGYSCLCVYRLTFKYPPIDNPVPSDFRLGSRRAFSNLPRSRAAIFWIVRSGLPVSTSYQVFAAEQSHYGFSKEKR